MNSAACPAGYYTDRAFQRAAPDECATPIWLFWFCTMTMCALRFVAFLKKIDNLARRVQAGTGQQKFSYGLFSHGFAVIMYLITCVTIGTNAANVENGISFSLYSISYLSFIINYSVLLVRTVRLGQRLIPKAFHREDLGFLSRFSRAGLLLIVVQSISAVVACILLGIVCPIIPSEDVVLGVVGFATKGAFQMMCILGIVLQFERCIRALDGFRDQVLSSPTVGTDHEHHLNRTIRIMRQRQWTILLLGGGVSIIYIIFAAMAVPWTWAWVILGTAGIETFGSLVIEFCFASGSKAQKGTQQNTGDGGLASAAHGTRMHLFRSREDTPGSSPTTGPNNNDPKAMAPAVVPVMPIEEDELKDLPLISESGRKSSNTKRLVGVGQRALKRGPMGFRLKRKPKPEIDLTRVTEEQSYYSSMNPVASAAVTRAASLSQHDVESSDQ